MTLITRLAAPALAPVLAAALVVGGATTASAKPPIDPLLQHVRVVTKNSAGMQRDSTLYGRWRHDHPLPILNIRGSNDMAATTTVTASSPVPGLSRSHARGYCVVQHYAARTLDPATASLGYRTSVVVRRHHRVVARHTSSGTYTSTASPTGTNTGPTLTARDPYQFAGFRFHRGDHVTWSVTTTVSNQVKKFRTRAEIAPHC